MGRFSWGKARAKSRKDPTTSVVEAPTNEAEKAKSDSPLVASSSSSSSSSLSTSASTSASSSSTSSTAVCAPVMFLALCAASICGYCMESTSVRFSNAMFTSHLFSEYKAPRRLHMSLLHSRRSSPSVTAVDPVSLWSPPSDYGWKPCLNRTFEGSAAAPEPTNGYLQVMCSGGLFQIHICVCNAVAVAKLVNATLLVPYFRESLVWNDPSQFGDIYDIEHFVTYFKNDVQIIRRLPDEYTWSTPDLYAEQCEERPNCVTRVAKHSTMRFYLEKLPPLLERHGLAVLDGPTQYSGWDHKLTFEGLPVHITKVRCRANFEGLRFVPAIQELGKRLVDRIRAKGFVVQSPIMSLNQTTAPQPWWFAQVEEFPPGRVHEDLGGRYVGLHVRFEKDMIAHSACYYGGGRAEKRSLAAFRAKVWSRGVTKTRYKPENLRMNGSCPLTPDEMGLLLSGLGFPSTTPLYLASKDLYGGKSRIKPLREIFPLLESKYTLATKKELRPFLPYSHKLAALDFLVLLNSDVFMSNAAGNFPNVLSGQRTFYGPRKSIHADKRLLANLFANSSVDWPTFSARVIEGHQNRLGAPVRRMTKYSIYRYPAPDCMRQEPITAASGT